MSEGVLRVDFIFWSAYGQNNWTKRRINYLQIRLLLNTLTV